MSATAQVPYAVWNSIPEMAEREITVDLFAGGGGMSEGMENAMGRSVDIAINHDPEAIAMHKVNHPHTEHYCEDVFEVQPLEATRGRPVAWLHASPDCTDFSKAKGDRPREKKIRGLAWVIVKWAQAVRPRVITMENVEEFQEWGPLLPNGKADPNRRGETFGAFVACLTTGLDPEHPAMEEIRHALGEDFPYEVLAVGLGYDFEFRELLACDYGAPTKRKRLIGIGKSDGGEIVWPEQTHGDPKSLLVQSGKLKPWRTAAEIIDWTIPCPSIFTRKKALAPKTMARIARGLKKFVIDHPNPFIAPIRNVVVDDHSEKVAAFLIHYHSETTGREVRGQTLEEPLYTIDTSNRFALVTSHIIKMRNTNYGHPMTEPLHTITAGGMHLGEVRAFLMKYYGQGEGQTLDEPIHTIPTKDRFGLVVIHTKTGPEYWQIVDIGMRMLEPHELYAGQGFRSTYEIDRDITGKRITKKSKVARCGNSVPPHFGEHIGRANLPELCGVPGGHTAITNLRVGQMNLFDEAIAN